jgi:Aldehyde dehydrogenase family
MAVAMTASQAQEPTQPRVSARATFESLNPATGQPIATFLVPPAGGRRHGGQPGAGGRALVGRPRLAGTAQPAGRLDKIAFTGSAATARKVMAAAAENLTPVIAECGGKDALIVDADADLSAAADAAAWGALSNAGQTCVGIERVYVADPVYETFLAKLADRVSRLRPGSDDGADYGPGLLARGLGWRGAWAGAGDGAGAPGQLLPAGSAPQGVR